MPTDAATAAIDDTTQDMTPDQRAWADMALQILCEEYVQAHEDLKTIDDGAETMRRHYRRFALVQERTLANEAAANGDEPACRKGCSYCCHNRVVAPAHEVMMLADRILAMPEPQRAALVERISINAERIGPTIDGTTPFTTPMPCALLGEDGACGVYEDRPSNCRRYHSLRRSDCENSFFQPNDLNSRVRLSTPLLVASAAQAMGFRKAIGERGIDTTNYELHTALREALADPAAVGERLSRGEKGFVHAAVESTS
jgi:Fe-S-cluster containining protein